MLKRKHKFSLLPSRFNGDWSLKISNIMVGDEDSYQCIAGFDRTRVTLTVEGSIGNIMPMYI